MPLLLKFIVGLLYYMFPYTTVAKIIVLLLERLAKATSFTQVDDEVVAVMRRQLMTDEEAAKDDTNAG